MLSIDFEEYYQGILTIPEADYTKYQGRITSVGMELLELLDQQDIRATFFVSGHVAERYPDVVREVARRGHEIGCHGFSHGLVCKMTKDQFLADIVRAMNALEKCIDAKKVLGYRAPWWSLNRSNQWAWEVLEHLGFRYDSSIPL